MYRALRIYHHNLIPFILKALLGNYRLRCNKLVNVKNKISRLSNYQNREHLKYLKTFYYHGDQSQHGSGHTSKPHRRATGSPGSMDVRLHFNFIGECMRTNKICS